jgi:hypothetical protein
MGSYAYKYCMCFTRKFRSPDAQPPPDVRAAHLSFASDAHALRRFVAGVQGESPADVDRILAMLSGGHSHGIARLVTRSPAASTPTLEDFFAFLFSPDLNPPIAHQVVVNRMHHSTSTEANFSAGGRLIHCSMRHVAVACSTKTPLLPVCLSQPKELGTLSLRLCQLCYLLPFYRDGDINIAATN